MESVILKKVVVFNLLCLLNFDAAKAQNEHCASRIVPDFDETAGSLHDDDRCPYIVNAERWTPGERIMIQVVGGESEIPFSLFLVSIQHGSSLIGEMSSGPDDNNVSMVTCGTTSMMNADTSNKTEVEFSWMAPEDLDTEDVIVRASVGTADDFWVDCDLYYLSRSEDLVNFDTTTAASTEPPTAASTDPATAASTDPTTAVPVTTGSTTSAASVRTRLVPTTTAPSTIAPTTTAADSRTAAITTRMMAGPDIANQGTTTAQNNGNQQTSTAAQTTQQASSGATSCSQYGNTYEIVEGSGCSQFKQIANGRSYTFNCPPTTIFVAEPCTCSSFGECALP